MSPRKRRLIVNADDLGRTPGINSGVFEGHRRGVVSSATLMVALPWAAAAVTEAARSPGLGLGLHLTLTGAPPTLAPERVPSLVDSGGRLPPRPEALGAADPAEVLAEVRSQLDRFRVLVGRMPTHLDSHHHAHRVPVVLEAVVAVAREHGLPVRRASPEVGRRLRRAGVGTTDLFVDRFFGAGARLETLLEVIAELPAGLTEVMCHPGRVDVELRADSSYVDEREREIEILTDPEVRRALVAEGIELVDFGAACVC